MAKTARFGPPNGYSPMGDTRPFEDNKLTEKVCGLDQLDLWIGRLGTDGFCNLTLSKYIGILKNFI